MDLLNDVEVRVLGSLIEKDVTTPDYYPLSLNALVNACNQKNNRDPVMMLDEDAVRDALDSLQVKRLAGPSSGADSRVTKYEHRLQEVFNFDRREIAVLCVLLLRGAQTAGELRGRAERMYRFEGLGMCMERWTGSATASLRWLPCCRASRARRSRATCICSRALRFPRNRRELRRILREWRILRERIGSPFLKAKWRNSESKLRECRTACGVSEAV